MISPYILVFLLATALLQNDVDYNVNDLHARPNRTRLLQLKNYETQAGSMKFNVNYADIDIQKFISINKLPERAYCNKKSCWSSMALSCIYLAVKNKYLCVSRIAHQEDQNNQIRQILWAKNSFLSYMIYSSNYEVVDEIEFNGITFRSYQKLKIIEYIFDSISMGPEDPNIMLSDNSEVYVLFCQLNQRSKRRFFVYNARTNSQIQLSHGFFNPERNWNPISIANNNLAMIYRLKPISFLTCDIIEGNCQDIPEYAKDPITMVRPSSNLYKLHDIKSYNDHYISFGRVISGVGKKFQYSRVYHPFILLFDPNLKCIYISKIIDLKTQLKPLFHYNIVINIMSIVRYDPTNDILVVTVNVQDRVDAFLEIKYFSQLLNEFNTVKEVGDSQFAEIITECDKLTSTLSKYVSDSYKTK